MSKLRDLHIVEISSCIHTGKVNTNACIKAELKKGPDGWYEPKISTGGVALLFNKVFDFGKRGDIVFVADRPPTVKRSFYPDYKTHREMNQSVSVQKEMAEDILIDCGFLVLYEEGYEADDLAYTLAEKYAKEYRNVYVHTDDSDLFIVVRDNVHVLPVKSTGKIVTQENYETQADSKAITPFNSLSFLKMLHGDKRSDNVDALPKPLQEKLKRLLWNETYFKFMRNRTFMRALIEDVAPEALNQFEVIYPLYLESLSIGMLPEPDWARVKAWAHEVGNRKFGVKSVTPKSIKERVKYYFEECHYADEED